MYLLDPKNLTGNHRQFLLSVILFELLLDLTLKAQPPPDSSRDSQPSLHSSPD